MKLNKCVKFFSLFLFCCSIFTGTLNAQPKTKNDFSSSTTLSPQNVSPQINIDKEPHRNKVKPDNYSMQCSIYNFDLFFQLFSEDQAFQRTATLFPLKKTVQRPSDLKKDMVTTIIFIKPEEGPFTELSRQQRISRKLGYSINDDKHSEVRVILRKESTGIRFEYVFIWDGCWFLSEIIDSST